MSPKRGDRVTVPTARDGTVLPTLAPPRWRRTARRCLETLRAEPRSRANHERQHRGVPLREIAEAIGRQLTLPVVSVAAVDAGNHFGFLGPLVSIDNPTSSALTQERLGWGPTHPPLIADIKEGHYFND